MSDYEALAAEIRRAWMRAKPPKLPDMIPGRALASSHRRDIETLGWDERDMLAVFGGKKTGRRFDELDCSAALASGFEPHFESMSDAARAYYLGGLLYCIAGSFLPANDLAALNVAIEHLGGEVRHMAHSPCSGGLLTRAQAVALVRTIGALREWGRVHVFAVYGVDLADVHNLIPTLEAIGPEFRDIDPEA